MGKLKTALLLTALTGVLMLGDKDVFAAVPAAPVLISPADSIADSTPTYKWNAVSGTVSYQLLVKTASGLEKINQSFTAAQAGCSSDSVCAVTPATSLPLDSYLWKVRGKNAAGTGPWSTAKSFKRVKIPPAPVLVSPSGAVTTATPTYKWNAASNAASYQLFVSSPAGTEINRWYTAAQAGCVSGGICRVTPSTSLENGTHSWKVRGKNVAGTGAWSASKSFTTEDLSACNVVLLPSNDTGGCHIRLVEPANCEEIDLTNGKTYLFGWTTDGSYCETPFFLYIGGSPADLVTGENTMYWELSTSTSDYITHYGGVWSVSAADLDEFLTTDNGIYHWVVAGWFGSHPASQTFRVKK